jgi:hypothetical protein
MCNLSTSGVMKITSPILRDKPGLKQSIMNFNKTEIIVFPLKLG